MANTSLLGPLASESFTNSAARYAATLTASGTTGTVQTTTATISFNSADQSYTLSTPSGSLTFRQSDIDASKGNAGAVVYVRNAGGFTNTLTLTRPGTSGPITYQYVGGAFWERTDLTNGGTQATAIADALVYGVETPASAVPRSGSANYNIDVVGVLADTGAVLGLVGAGTAALDFASGQILLVGSMDIVGAPFPTQTFLGNARLSSSANSFTGTFTFTKFGEFTGPMQGMLFGPTGQEIGAAWSADSTGDGRVAAGVVLGRRGAADAGNATFGGFGQPELTNSQTFSTSEAVLDFNFAGDVGTNQQTGDFSAMGTRTAPLIIRYDASRNAYILADNEYVAIYQNGSFVREGYLGAVGTASLYTYDPVFRGGRLQYTRQARWTDARGSSGPADVRMAHYLFGMETGGAAVPRTGSAGFLINVRGTAADNAFRNPMLLNGTGGLFVNFGSGAVNGQAEVAFGEEVTLSGLFPEERRGSWTFAGTMSSSSNGLSGTVTVEGLGTYSGTASGRFFGPAADEVGGQFTANEAGGGSMAGTFAGYRSDTVTDPLAPFPTLATVTAPGSLAIVGVTQSLGSYLFKSMTVQPSAGNYVLGLASNNSDPAEMLVLDATTRNAAASNARFTAYDATFVGRPLTVRLASDPGVRLSYTSFGDVRRTDWPQYNYYGQFVYGLKTTAVATGTATYSGVAYGDAETSWNPGGFVAYEDYEVNGSASMGVDFGRGTYNLAITGLTGVRTLSDRERPGFATITFAPLAINGTIENNVLTQLDPRWFFSGYFFGPNAEEFGGVFRTDNIDPLEGESSSSTYVSLAVVGKRD